MIIQLCYNEYKVIIKYFLKIEVTFYSFFIVWKNRIGPRKIYSIELFLIF